MTPADLSQARLRTRYNELRAQHIRELEFLASVIKQEADALRSDEGRFPQLRIPLSFENRVTELTTLARFIAA